MLIVIILLILYFILYKKENFDLGMTHNTFNQLDDMLVLSQNKNVSNISSSLSKVYYCSGYNWNGKQLKPCYKHNKWTCCGDDDYDVNWNLRDNIKIHDGGPCRNMNGFQIKKWRELKNKPGVCYIKRSSFPSDTNYYPGQPCCRFLDKSRKYCVIDFNKESNVQNINGLLNWGNQCKFDVI